MKQRPKGIRVTAYEMDVRLAGELGLTFEACRSHAAQAGVHFEGDIRNEDFIEAGVAALTGGLFPTDREEFDCAILNPPYRRINTDSRIRRLLETVGAETTNLYAAFLSLSLRLLKPQGELVTITPRSFCNGPYFRSFRTRFLDEMVLRRLHSFEARDQAFAEDEVLQENVIVHAVKRPTEQGMVVVSSTTAPEDECPTWRELDFGQIVKANDPDRFIHIPTDDLSDAIEDRMSHFSASLSDLGIDVSTGRVVDFRVPDLLCADPGAETVPLIFPGHFADGFVEWPRMGGKKPNALLLTKESEGLLVPRGFYVLVKRFSSKEEPRRIVAAVYDPARLPTLDVAFENHLNYFHAHGRPLEENVAKGLAAFLNSSLVDCHFRDWSGHTQVNASDLRRLPYPTTGELRAIGARIGEEFPDQDEIDRRFEEDLLSMASLKKSPDPIRGKKRVKEALAALKDLGLPREQQNERSALALLALLDLKPKTPWSAAESPLRGITEMMEFFAEQYGRRYAPNTRETVRRYTVHQFVQAGIAVPNPDKPSRPTNSPDTVYQIELAALSLLRTYGGSEWTRGLREHLTSIETLTSRYAKERAMQRIPIALPDGTEITLSPGGQNVLVKQILDDFCSRFTPAATPIYVGDTEDKWAYFDEQALKSLGVAVDSHGKMPDVVVHFKAKGWLVLIEAVTSHGPMSPKRHAELKELFKGAKAGLVFVTAFLTRRDLVKYLHDIAWETEVWVAETPTHMIHFNGERFLGPF